MQLDLHRDRVIWQPRYAQCGTLRTKLLKVAARVRITARRVWLSFPTACPHAEAFATAAALRRQPTRAPPA